MWRLYIQSSEEPDLSWIVSGPNETSQVGPEEGVPKAYGISVFRDSYGSFRYVYYSRGQAIAGLQVVSDGNQATVANVFTAPEYRRRGLASELFRAAKRDFPNLQHSNEPNQVAQDWISGMERNKNILDDEILQEYLDANDLSGLLPILDANDISYDEVEFPTGKKVMTIDMPDNIWVIEFGKDGLYYTDDAYSWISDTIDRIHEFYTETDTTKEFWNSVGSGSHIYHGTYEDRVESIMQNGLESRCETRGLSNKSMGCGIFAVPEPSHPVLDSYDVIIQINIGDMKQNGYMPDVSYETPVEEAEWKNSVAHAIGIEDFDAYADIESGLYTETVALYGDIPPKYLSIYTNDRFAFNDNQDHLQFTKFADYDDYREDITRLWSKNTLPFKHWFPEGQNRIYFPLAIDQGNQYYDEDVAATLQDINCVITDYKGGYCQQGNRVFRIGKAIEQARRQALQQLQQKYQAGEIYNLQREMESTNKWYDEVLDTFVNSPYRAQKAENEFTVVISQDPHDIAQMSTGRHWTSCMDMDQGSQSHNIYCEVESGGLVAYLIHKNDPEIQNPIARIHIRRFENRQGDNMAVPEKSVYGQEIPGFEQAVRNFVNEKQQESTPGFYQRRGGDYSDTFGGSMLIAPQNSEEILKWLRGGSEDAVFSTWKVVDNLKDDFNYNEDEEDDVEREFDTKEEAEQYAANLDYDDSWRDYHGDEWLEQDEETGEWINERYEVQEKPHDYRHDMLRQAIQQILEAPKGVYPKEVIDEVADKIKGMYKGDRLWELLARTYPEYLDNQRFKEVDRREWYKHMRDMEPGQSRDNLFAEEVQQAMSWLDKTGFESWMEGDPELKKLVSNLRMATDVSTQANLRDHISLRWNVMFDQVVLDPLNELFGHHTQRTRIPENIVHKLTNFALNVIPKIGLAERNNEGPIKNRKTDYGEQTISRIVHLFSMSGTDTPSVQNFYKALLPKWGDRHKWNKNYSFFNVETLGSAIANLRENGRDFLPFMRRKLEEEQQSKADKEAALQGPPPESFQEEYQKRQWQRDLAGAVKASEKDIERYLYIIDAIENGKPSGKYKFFYSRWNYKYANDVGRISNDIFETTNEAGEPTEVSEIVDLRPLKTASVKTDIEDGWQYNFVTAANIVRVFKGWVPYDYDNPEEPLITRVQRPSEFPIFTRDEPSLTGIAGFFTTDRNVAQRFADLISSHGVVGTFDIELGKVYEIDAKGRPAGIIQFEKTGREFQEAVRSGQYDTIIIRNTSDEGDIFVVLNPNNITIVDSGVNQNEELRDKYNIGVQPENNTSSDRKEGMDLSSSNRWNYKYVNEKRAWNYNYIKLGYNYRRWIYRYGQNQKISPILWGLAAEARKYHTFDDFVRAFLGQIKHGMYWHVTDNPNFSIDSQKGPRDMSSMAPSNAVDPGKLMITSHLSYWASNYAPHRQYAALIDMSRVPKELYYQVNRGMGNEFIVLAPEKAEVVGVFDIKDALRIDEEHHNDMPHNEPELREFWELARQQDMITMDQNNLKNYHNLWSPEEWEQNWQSEWAEDWKTAGTLVPIYESQKIIVNGLNYFLPQYNWQAGGFGQQPSGGSWPKGAFHFSISSNHPTEQYSVEVNFVTRNIEEVFDPTAKSHNVTFSARLIDDGEPATVWAGFDHPQAIILAVKDYFEGGSESEELDEPTPPIHDPSPVGEPVLV